MSIVSAQKWSASLMKSGLGLFQLWLVGTAIWMIGWIIMINSNCASEESGVLVCRPDFLQQISAFVASRPVTMMELALWGLTVPVTALVALVAGYAGFRHLRQGRPDS